jgi:hypothetical protein
MIRNVHIVEKKLKRDFDLMSGESKESVLARLKY